ncbi:MAG: ATP phosphoribosyltransferase regulatory subunit [Eubacterium sp.]
MEDAVPIRLCYTGNTFINNNSYQGRLKESTQMGAELIGNRFCRCRRGNYCSGGSAYKPGLSEFQLSVGHVDYLSGLFEAAKLDEETRS